MSRNLALSFCLAFIAFLLYRDSKTRARVSSATWLPAIWVLILASRPVSTWLGGTAFQESAAYSLDGSPLDRWVFLLLLFGSLIVLQKRQLRWGEFLAANKVIILLYAYLALTVLWASSPFVSFKRWTKDFGNVLMVLVILSDRNPQEAIRAVFVRCGFVLLPLSVLVLRYFPDIGRSYNRWTGAMEATGLTFQKNSLGGQVLAVGLILVWDIVHRLQLSSWRSQKLDLGIRFGILLLGAYLLKVSDSKTATVCLVIGSGIIAGIGIDVVRRNAARMVFYGAVSALVVFSADRLFGITEFFVGRLGRDMTFTGRTNIWDELLNLHTNPIWGTGFINLWSDFRYLDKLPDFATHTAHNGYLEIYLDGGLFGVALLAIMLLSIGRGVHRHVLKVGDYGMVQFAILVAILILNISESNFFRMSPNWFLFLLTAIDYRRLHAMRIIPNQPTPGRDGPRTEASSPVRFVSGQSDVSVLRA